MFLDEADIDRFWSGVNIRGSDECWPWFRYCNEQGYGRFWLKKKLGLAHRVAWTLQNGQIPELFEGLPVMICHSCDNPPCCNPNHLFLGNNIVNMLDSSFKGRKSIPKIGSRGEGNSQALLVELDVKGIKRYLEEGRLFHRQIAEMYGVNRHVISDISAGKRWSHAVL